MRATVLRRIGGVLAFAATVAGCAPPAARAPVASLSARDAAQARDIDGFTAYVARRLGAAMPESRLVVRGPLTLQGTGAFEGQINLDRMWSFCVRNAVDCDREMEVYLANTARSVAEFGQPLNPRQLRIVVRPEQTIAELRRAVASAGGGEPIADRLSGDLWRACMFDFPSSARFVVTADLAKLGLSREQALQACEQNVAATLRPLAEAAKPLPSRGIGVIEGHEYDSSRVALHHDWRPLAESMDGNLIVAVPGTHLVFYADARQPNAMEALSTLAGRAMASQPRPISATILRWTPQGWQAAGR